MLREPVHGSWAGGAPWAGRHRGGPQDRQRLSGRRVAAPATASSGRVVSAEEAENRAHPQGRCLRLLCGLPRASGGSLLHAPQIDLTGATDDRDALELRVLALRCYESVVDRVRLAGIVDADTRLSEGSEVSEHLQIDCRSATAGPSSCPRTDGGSGPRSS